MSGDVVDFAPVRQARKRTRLNWQAGNGAVPLAGLGALLCAASLFVEWISVNLPNGGGRAGGITVFAVASVASIYGIGLMALVAIVALALLGDHPDGAKNLRVLGLALGGALVVFLAAIGNLLTSGTDGSAFFFYDLSSAQQRPAQDLALGFYAAFGGVVALGSSLLLPPPVRGEPVLDDEEDEAEFEEDAVDLEVTVEPVREPGR